MELRADVLLLISEAEVIRSQELGHLPVLYSICVFLDLEIQCTDNKPEECHNKKLKKVIFLRGDSKVGAVR